MRLRFRSCPGTQHVAAQAVIDLCDVTDRKRMSLQAVTLFRKCLRSAAAQGAFTVVGNVDCTLPHAQTTQNNAETVGPEPAMSGKMLDKNTSKWAKQYLKSERIPSSPPHPPSQSRTALLRNASTISNQQSSQALYSITMTNFQECDKNVIHTGCVDYVTSCTDLRAIQVIY